MYQWASGNSQANRIGSSILKPWISLSPSRVMLAEAPKWFKGECYSAGPTRNGRWGLVPIYLDSFSSSSILAKATAQEIYSVLLGTLIRQSCSYLDSLILSLGSPSQSFLACPLHPFQSGVLWCSLQHTGSCHWALLADPRTVLSPASGYSFLWLPFYGNFPHLYLQKGWVRSEVPIVGSLLVYLAYLLQSVLYNHWSSVLFSCWNISCFGEMTMFSSFVPISSCIHPYF